MSGTGSVTENGRGEELESIKSLFSTQGSQKRMSKTEKSRIGKKVFYLEIWRISLKNISRLS